MLKVKQESNIRIFLSKNDEIGNERERYSPGFPTGRDGELEKQQLRQKMEGV